MEKDRGEIQRELEALKARNKRVELDKAWETSWTRKLVIAVMTYALIVIFMMAAKLERPFISAIVPSVAYLISVSALPVFKKWWIKK